MSHPEPTDELTIRRKDGVSIVGFTNHYLQSEDAATRAGAALLALIEDRVAPKIVLSFEGVRFVSSSMIAQVMRVQKAVTKANGKLRLCNLAPPVRDILHASQLDRLLDIHETEAAALTKF